MAKDPRQALKEVADRHPEWKIVCRFEQGGQQYQPVWMCTYFASDNGKDEREIGKAEGGSQDAAKRAAAEIALELVRKWER